MSASTPNQDYAMPEASVAGCSPGNGYDVERVLAVKRSLESKKRMEIDFMLSLIEEGRARQ